ncbi:MAG: phage tail tape measure protein [Lachnospiraceae bacterium]|jgi:phage tail tape measure protein, TP901 family, core region/phage tail tape measure protein, TP901 family, core region
MAAKGGKEMEIAIKIAGKVQSSFKSALNAATKGVGRLGSKIADVSGKGLKAIPKGIGTVAKTVGAATAAAASAVGAMGVAAVRTGMDFEKSMSQVAATMLLDKSTEEGQKAFATLENAARQCGRETAFSATEAAEALNYLALAGYDAEKAAGALPTVLKLAGAGAMELAAASDMITDSMSALDIEATQENLESFADQMAQTASKSNTSVAQLGEAILTVGGTAKNLAGGTTELNTALGILADNGIKAAEGGTHLRNMILSLQSPRNAAAAAMFEDMGLSAYDAAGNMRSLGDIFGDINKSLSGASTQKVDETLSTIFKLTDLSSARAMLAATTDSVKSLGAVVDASLAGSGTSISKLGIDLKKMAKEFDAATSQKKFAQDMKKQFNMTGEQAGVLFNGLQSLASGTGNRFDELTKAVEGSAGACADMYAIQLDNLNGDIDILKSGLSDLGISIYKDLNAPLREMTQFATRMVSQLSFAFYEQGMEGMAGAAGNCLSAAVNALIGYAPKVTSLGISLLENFIDGITGNSGEIAGAASRVLSVFTEGLFKLVPKVITAGLDLILQFTQSITGELPQLMDSGTQAVTNLVDGIVSRLPEIVQTAVSLVENLALGLVKNAPALISSGAKLLSGLANALTSLLPQVAPTGIGIVMQIVQSVISGLPRLVNAGTNILTNIVNGIAQHLPAVITTALAVIQTFVNSLIQNTPQLLTAAIQLIGSLVLGIVQMLPAVIQMGIQLILSLAQGILSNLPLILQMGTQAILNLVSGITQSIPMLIQGGFQLITSLVQGIAQNLPAIAQAAFTIILSLIGGLITAIPQLWAAAKSLPGAIWDAIISVDWLEVGWDLIKSIGQGIIDGALSIGDSIINTVKGWFGGGDDEAASSGASAAQSYAAGMGSKGFAKSAVAAGFESGAFDGLNTAGAEMAGTQAGEAFSTGLNSSMASSSLDTAGFNANMASAGNAGAEALSNGFNTGLAGISVDAASLVDTSSMAEAGNAGVSAVIDGMNNSLAGASVGIGAAAVDTSGINAAFMDAGVSGADAISTGMTGNSQSVIQAASSLGMEVNTSMDESWKKMEQGTQTAMQKLTSTVTNAARSAANAVKLAFENMSITIPKPKLPVISVDYKTKSYGNGGNIKVPGFNVAWNAAGGIFNRPTIFNTPAGMQGVGEAGPEAVLPLDMLWAKMKEILNDAVTINDGSSVINSLLEKLKGTGNNNSRNTPELAGAGGVNIQYSPVYNLYGSATKQDAIEAGRISMAEFKKLMKQHEKDLKRKKL